MVLSTGLMISLGTTILFCGLLFIFFRQRINNMDYKINLLFETIKEESEKRNRALQQMMMDKRKEESSSTSPLPPVSTSLPLSHQSQHKLIHISDNEDDDEDTSSNISETSDEEEDSENDDEENNQEDEDEKVKNEEPIEYFSDMNHALNINVIKNKKQVDDLFINLQIEDDEVEQIKKDVNDVDSVTQAISDEEDEHDEEREKESNEEDENDGDDGNEEENDEENNNEDKEEQEKNDFIRTIQINPTNYKQYTVSELREMVKQRQLAEHPTKLKKQELIDLLKE